MQELFEEKDSLILSSASLVSESLELDSKCTSDSPKRNSDEDSPNLDVLDSLGSWIDPFKLFSS